MTVITIPNVVTIITIVIIQITTMATVYPFLKQIEGCLLVAFAGSEGKLLFDGIGWKGRIWQL